MIWLPQIPHFMRESMPSSSECCEECNSTACQALLARDETVEPCLHAMSKGSVAAMCLLAPRPARLWPRNAEEEFTRGAREGVLLS